MCVVSTSVLAGSILNNWTNSQTGEYQRVFEHCLYFTVTCSTLSTVVNECVLDQVHMLHDHSLSSAYSAFNALTLLVGRQKEHPACKKWVYGGLWALVSPDGVAPSRMVSVSASVNLPLHHKVQKFSSGTGSPGWSRKKGRKTVV